MIISLVSNIPRSFNIIKVKNIDTNKESPPILTISFECIFLLFGLSMKPDFLPILFNIGVKTMTIKKDINKAYKMVKNILYR